MRGCEQLAGHLAEEGISRVLLLTDGLANHGITDHPTLVRHAAELRQRGIATSTFGVGADFDERLLRDMALEGGGNFYFVSAPAQIPDLLTSELGEALEVVAPRAALEILLPTGADAQPLSRFRYARALGDNELRVELGDLASGQEVRAVIQVTLPVGTVGVETSIRIDLTADGERFPREVRQVRWTYASHEANDAQPRDQEVDREVATMYAAMARAEATEANRNGDFGRARRVLERTAARIREYAGSDREMNRLARELLDEVSDYSERLMAPMELKAAMYRSENEWKGRDSMGRARRGR
jgi:Ca-activated chloride channel family protein